MTNSINYRFENNVRAFPLSNSNGSTNSRLQFFDYTGEKGDDLYAVAAEMIQGSDGKAPVLDWWDRQFNVLHQAADRTWYKININSLKKRFRISSKELDGAVNNNTLEKLLVEKKNPIPNKLWDNGRVAAYLPKQQLLEKSVQIKANDQKFVEWTNDDHSESYKYMQRIAQTWKKSGYTDQYMSYGKVDENAFTWEIVPYKKCNNIISRIVQQLKVLFRIVFGGVEADESLDACSDSFDTPDSASQVGNDPFCKDDTMDRQRVIEGNLVNVLYNYAPIGFGGERLHFLIMPKAHRKAFTDLTSEEYSELMSMAKKLIEHFPKERAVDKNAYFLLKTGEDAGQTQDHLHLHVIFTDKGEQDLYGKMTVMKNILLGSSPMDKIELDNKVKSLRDELK